MKRALTVLLSVLLCVGLTACGRRPDAPEAPEKSESWPDAVVIELSDDGIGVNAQTEAYEHAVRIDHDIVYYEEGKDFTYGEGTEADAHSAAEAENHTVVHITQPGRYVLRGTLSAGQIAVDLGEDADEDPDAVVTLILDGVDITCTVAPAVIFYNVYECGSADTETATKDVNTSAAGANVIIADGSENIVNGSYVARIYKPDSVELSEDGTEVLDAKKLHKYDAAFYSKMSMNVDGGEAGSGILRINAANEGLDSELHLTINGGNINITSGNDGINTNEDGVSVTTINDGTLTIHVTGETGEGDGIDSNGWLVINGGKVIAAACNNSADSGIDSDMGIHINGGTVMATGHMLDRIEAGGQNYAVFNFAGTQSGDTVVSLKNTANEELMALWPMNDYSVLVFSSPELTEGKYTLWSDGTQLAGSAGGFGGGMGGGFRPGGMMPGGAQIPELEGFDPAQLPEFPVDGEEHRRPEKMEPPEGFEPPEGMERPQGFPGGMGGRGPNGMGTQSETRSETFTVTAGGSMFSGVTIAAK